MSFHPIHPSIHACIHSFVPFSHSIHPFIHSIHFIPCIHAFSHSFPLLFPAIRFSSIELNSSLFGFQFFSFHVNSIPFISSHFIQSINSIIPFLPFTPLIALIPFIPVHFKSFQVISFSLSVIHRLLHRMSTPSPLSACATCEATRHFGWTSAIEARGPSNKEPVQQENEQARAGTHETQATYIDARSRVDTWLMTSRSAFSKPRRIRVL